MTVFLVLGLFVGLVLVLAVTARGTRASGQGCCAPSDPRDDLRMRAAFLDEDDTER